LGQERQIWALFLEPRVIRGNTESPSKRVKEKKPEYDHDEMENPMGTLCAGSGRGYTDLKGSQREKGEEKRGIKFSAMPLLTGKEKSPDRGENLELQHLDKKKGKENLSNP